MRHQLLQYGVRSTMLQSIFGSPPESTGHPRNLVSISASTTPAPASLPFTYCELCRNKIRITPMIFFLKTLPQPEYVYIGYDSIVLNAISLHEIMYTLFSVSRKLFYRVQQILLFVLRFKLTSEFCLRL